MTSRVLEGGAPELLAQITVTDRQPPNPEHIGPVVDRVVKQIVVVKLPPEEAQ